LVIRVGISRNAGFVRQRRFSLRGIVVNGGNNFWENCRSTP
jgi:hypothetical protein